MRTWNGCALRLCGWLVPLAMAPALHAQALLERPYLDIVEQANVRAIVRQPDGGAIVAGDFTTIDGTPRAGLARFAPDGTLDAAWNPDVGPVDELAVDADADVYAAVRQAASDGVPMRHRLVKLDGAGTGAPVDGWSVAVEGTVRTIAVDGGDVFVGGAFTNIGGQARLRLAKLSAQTGALDATWAPMLDDVVLTITVAGQLVYVGGHYSNVNGAAHPYFARFARGGAGAIDANWNVSPDRAVFESTADGAGTVYFARESVSVQTPEPLLRRFSLATGDVDANWQPLFDNRPRALAVGGGALYVGGGFSIIDGAAHVGIARFTLATGALDAAWTPTSAQVNGIAVSLDGSRVLAGGPGRENALPQPALVAFDAAGTTRAPVNAMKPSEVNTFARMHDGGLMIGGRFAQIDGQPRQHLARLKLDGTLDAAWRADTDYEVFRLAANAAGEIYAGGSFLKVAGQPRTAAAKFSAAGVLDAQWNPVLTDDIDPIVFAFAFGADGAVYLGGEFDAVNGQARQSLAKVDDATGAVDAAWNANLKGRGEVRSLQIDGDGRLYIAGGFPGIGNQTIANLARTTAGGAGAADAGWNPGALDRVSAITLHRGALYASGRYAEGAQSRSGVVKIAVAGNGAHDTSWNAAASLADVRDIAVDDAGSIYAAGTVYLSQASSSVPRAVKMLRSGTVDAAWSPVISGKGEANAVLVDAGGIVIGGALEAVDGFERLGIAAFGNDVIFGDGLEP